MNLTIFICLLRLVFFVSGARISQQKCAEYRKLFQPLYHGAGEDAAPREFPFMAAIANPISYVNGILISENFVLSLASSVISDPIIVLGDLEQHTYDALPKSYTVKRTFLHPDFNMDRAYADIKLYELDESINFNEYILPACLSLKDLSMSENIMEIGWGPSPTNFSSNNFLHKVSLNYISNERCQNSSSNTSYIRNIDKDAFFCAESKNGRRRFLRDFGSALISDDRDSFDDIIGFSWNYVTSKDINVIAFVRVSAYIDWIEKIVWPDSSEDIATTTLSAVHFAKDIGKKTLPTKFIFLIAVSVICVFSC